jgi:signal transduction histidine kinase
VSRESIRNSEVIQQDTAIGAASIQGREDLVPSQVKQILGDRFQELTERALQVKSLIEVQPGFSFDSVDTSFYNRLNELPEEDRKCFDSEYSRLVLQEAARLLGRIPTATPIQFTPEMYERAFDNLLQTQIILDDVVKLPCGWATIARTIAAGIEHDIIGAVGSSKETFSKLRRGLSYAVSEEEPACVQVSFCRSALRAQLAILTAEARKETFEPAVRLLPALRQASREGTLVLGETAVTAFNDDTTSLIDSSPDFIVALEASKAKQIFGNSDLLNLALFNLIKNASRVNANSPDLIISVSIENRVDTQHTIISIRDNGVGFPIETLRKRLHDRALKRHERGEALGDLDKRLLEEASAIEESELLATLLERGFGVSTQGTGLGLSIVNDAVALMGGELLLRNHTDGGAEVLIAIPLKGLFVESSG